MIKSNFILQFSRLKNQELLTHNILYYYKPLYYFKHGKVIIQAR